MKEVTIATRKEGVVVYEVVAFIDPTSLKEGGISEDAFRDEVRNVYATEIFRFLVRESVGKVLAGPKDRQEGKEDNPKRPLYEVRDEAIRALLDAGVRAEVRRIEDGKVKAVSRLTITSTGFIE